MIDPAAAGATPEILEALSQGWLTASLRENPVLSFASGAVAFAAIVGTFLRLSDNFWRSRSIDTASENLNKSYAERLAALSADFDRVLKRVESAERDRDAFYREKVDLSARVAVIEEQLITFRSDNERLRSENASLHTEGIELRSKVRELQSAATISQATIGELQGKVTALEAAANSRGRRASDFNDRKG